MFIKLKNNQDGFTLLDTVLGISILILILPTLLNIINDLNIKSMGNESINKGTAYANSIMNYVVGYRFDENYNTIGSPWTYPLGQNSGDYDDADDFISMDWSIIPGYAESGYVASTNVFYVDPSIDLLSSCAYPTNFKRIVTSVNHPSLNTPIYLTTIITPHGS
jgi:type II secretory pathway pseudopilin PulG